jgi:hypothetical protein
LVEPEADTFDELDAAVNERKRPGNPELVDMEFVEPRDEAVEEVTAGGQVRRRA